MNWRCWAGQVVDFINLHPDRMRDVVTDKLKIGLITKMCDVTVLTGKEVVQADYIVTLAHQPITQVRSKEPSPTCNYNALI